MAQALSPHALCATIDDLAWLAGSWYGYTGEDPIDEHWSAPAGGVMIGMFRWLKQGRLYMYEFLAIEPDDRGGLTLRLKHFHEGLVAWEGKSVVRAFNLVELGERLAVFRRGGAFRSNQFIYRRPDDDHLVVVEEVRKGGELLTNTFSYTRGVAMRRSPL
ncbi:MAG: DUF6265 family protein [Anaerolineae bacterium]|nr:DUF6265 family protein [Thermoflexales bacterium]MDW8407707.1 DUF6265 family protein [Anaerolineae bacterium]